LVSDNKSINILRKFIQKEIIDRKMQQFDPAKILGDENLPVKNIEDMMAHKDPSFIKNKKEKNIYYANKSNLVK